MKYYNKISKAIFLIILLSFFSGSAGAEFVASAELGRDVQSPVMYTELSVGYNFRLWNMLITPYGRQLTWFESDGADRAYLSGGKPYRDVYNIGVQAKYGHIVFGADHYCSHAVYTGDNWQKYNTPVNNSQLTRVFVRYEFK